MNNVSASLSLVVGLTFASPTTLVLSTSKVQVSTVCEMIPPGSDPTLEGCVSNRYYVFNDPPMARKSDAYTRCQGGRHFLGKLQKSPGTNV